MLHPKDVRPLRESYTVPKQTCGLIKRWELLSKHLLPILRAQVDENVEIPQEPGEMSLQKLCLCDCVARSIDFFVKQCQSTNTATNTKRTLQSMTMEQPRRDSSITNVAKSIPPQLLPIFVRHIQAIPGAESGPAQTSNDNKIIQMCQMIVYFLCDRRAVTKNRNVWFVHSGPHTLTTKNPRIRDTKCPSAHTAVEAASTSAPSSRDICCAFHLFPSFIHRKLRNTTSQLHSPTPLEYSDYAADRSIQTVKTTMAKKEEKKKNTNNNADDNARRKKATN